MAYRYYWRMRQFVNNIRSQTADYWKDLFFAYIRLDNEGFPGWHNEQPFEIHAHSLGK